MLQVLNETTFSEHIGPNSGETLVEFFATWCPHCKRMQPIIEDVATRLEPGCPVYQVDVDESPALAQQYAPDGFPTFVLFDRGEVVRSLTGEQEETTILDMVKGA